MKKRGQTTLFIIVGLVIVILVVLLFITRPSIIPIFGEDLDQELENIEEQIKECLTDISDEPIKRIGLQGGYLATPTGSYRLYNDSRISYLCYNMQGTEQCSNRMLLIGSMEDELTTAIQQALPTCLNVQKFSQFKSYTISTPENPEIDVSIRNFDTVVALDYPVILTSKRSEASAERSEFDVIFDYPLGRLYEVSQEIVNQEAEFGTFDVLYYMLSKKGEIKIYPKKPYPDKIYTLKHQNSDYIFQFAIEGEPR